MRRDRERPDTELTGLHRELLGIIQGMGVQVVAEYPVGPYRLDCYLPEAHIGVEADGPGHSKSRDRRRARAIYDNYRIPILHLSDAAIKKEDRVREAVDGMIRDFAGNAAERKREAREYERLYDA